MARWDMPAAVEPPMRRWLELHVRWSPAGHAFVSDLYADWQRWVQSTRSMKSDERRGLLQIGRQNFTNYVKQLLPVGTKYRSNGRACFRGIVIDG
jgi:hypothetical protein